MLAMFFVAVTIAQYRPNKAAPMNRLILATFMITLTTLSGCANKELQEQNASLQQQLIKEEAAQQQLRKDYADKLQKAERLSEKQRIKANREIEALRLDLDEALRKNDVQIQHIENLTIIELEQTALFPSGQVDLTPEGKAVMKQLAATFKRHPQYQMRIEGHSDNMPLNKALQKQYISNWELSAIRAATVAKYLIYALDVPKERISIAGYADTRPVTDNDSQEGRDSNRRIRAVLYK